MRALPYVVVVSMTASVLVGSALGQTVSEPAPPHGAIQDRWPEAPLPRRDAPDTGDRATTPSPRSSGPTARVERPDPALERSPVLTRRSAKAQRREVRRTSTATRAARRTVRASYVAARTGRTPVQPSFQPRLLTLSAGDRAAIYRALAGADPNFGDARSQATGPQLFGAASQSGYAVPVVRSSAAAAPVGTTLAPNIRIAGLPTSLAGRIPTLRPYGYALVDGRLLIVDPATGVVVADATR